MFKEFEKRWFQASEAQSDAWEISINERALRARAGLMLLISAILLYTRIDHGHHMEVVFVAQDIHAGMGHGAGHNMATTATTMVPREYSHLHVFALLGFIIYEMIMPMFRATAKFSVTAQLGAWLTRNQTPIYTPMRPKVFAWSIGAAMAVTCFGLVYAFVATGFMSPLPLILLITCSSFMWLEATAGICAGCVVYSWLVRIGVIRGACESCATVR